MKSVRTGSLAALILGTALIAGLSCQPRTQEPSSLADWLAVAAGHEQAKRYNDAFIAYKQALALNAQSYEALYGLAESCWRLADPESGLEWIRQALELKPGDAQAQGLRGRLRMSSGRLAEGISDMEQALARDADQVDTQLALVQAYEFRKQPAQALARAAAAVQRFPRHAEAHHLYGRLLSQDRQLPEAEQHFREALKLDPAMAIAKLSLAALLVDQHKDLEGARRLAQEAAAKGDDLGTAAGVAAWALFLQGSKKEALSELTKVATDHPRNLAVLVMLKRAAVELDESDLASRVDKVIRELTAPPRQP